MIVNKGVPINLRLYCLSIGLQDFLDIFLRAVKPFKKLWVLFLKLLEVTEIKVDRPLIGLLILMHDWLSASLVSDIVLRQELDLF